MLPRALRTQLLARQSRSWLRATGPSVCGVLRRPARSLATASRPLLSSAPKPAAAAAAAPAPPPTPKAGAVNSPRSGGVAPGAVFDTPVANSLLEKLLLIARQRRDAQWHSLFYRVLPNAEFAVVTGDNIYRGPDGFPYLSLLSAPQAAAQQPAGAPAKPLRALHTLVDVMAREGCGFVLDVHDKERFSVVTYGMVWCHKEFGSLMADYPPLWAGTARDASANGSAPSAPLRIEKLDTKHMRLSNPSPLLLPEYTRPHIAAWLKSVGCTYSDVYVAQPLAVATDSDEHCKLLFPLCREDFATPGLAPGDDDPKCDATWGKLNKKLRFFLPTNYPFLTASRDVIVKQRARALREPIPAKPERKFATANAAAPAAAAAPNTAAAKPAPKA